MLPSVPKRRGDDGSETKGSKVRLDETTPRPPALDRLFDGPADPVERSDTDTSEGNPE